MQREDYRHGKRRQLAEDRRQHVGVVDVLGPVERREHEPVALDAPRGQEGVRHPGVGRRVKTASTTVLPVTVTRSSPECPRLRDSRRLSGSAGNRDRRGGRRRCGCAPRASRGRASADRPRRARAGAGRRWRRGPPSSAVFVSPWTTTAANEHRRRSLGEERSRPTRASAIWRPRLPAADGEPVRGRREADSGLEAGSHLGVVVLAGMDEAGVGPEQLDDAAQLDGLGPGAVHDGDSRPPAVLLSHASPFTVGARNRA